MTTHVLDVLALDFPRTREVHVTCDPHGGWQIDALIDGRVVATRHCSDWHRVERARRALADTPPARTVGRLAQAGRT